MTQSNATPIPATVPARPAMTSTAPAPTLTEQAAATATAHPAVADPPVEIGA
ncbi:MAG: hypothetical protein ACRDRH_06210 [Pseudonocardia sp.]